MSKKPLAAFTIARNEAFWLPRWLKHYGATGAALYVLDHESDDGSTDNTGGGFVRFAVTRPHTDDCGWMLHTVEAFQTELLRGYEKVIFAECDEFLVPDPTFHSSLRSYLGNTPGATITATGFDICQRGSDAPLDLTRPILSQRGWRRHDMWDKTLISKIPMRWEVGFHRPDHAMGIPHGPDPTLFLLHFHYCDLETQSARLAGRRKGREPFPNSWGIQNKCATEAEFEADFCRATADAEAIPERLRGLM